MRDREKFEQYKKKYAEIILLILNDTGEKHPAISYQMILIKIIKDHYLRREAYISEEVALRKIKAAVLVLAERFLFNGINPSDISAAEMFDAIDSTLISMLP